MLRLLLQYRNKRTLLVSGGADQRVKLWNTSTGICLQTFEGHTDWVYGVDISADGQAIVSGSFDHTVRVWDVPHQRCMSQLKAHTDQVHAVAFAKQSAEAKGHYRIASGSSDETAKVWELPSATCLHTYRSNKPYEGTSLIGVRGLTAAQKTSLVALGAVI